MGTIKRENRSITAKIPNAGIITLLRTIYKVYEPEVHRMVLKMAVDCTGTRATGRILGISKDIVTAI